jgi:hypothetical protein
MHLRKLLSRLDFERSQGPQVFRLDDPVCGAWPCPVLGNVMSNAPHGSINAAILAYRAPGRKNQI